MITSKVGLVIYLGLLCLCFGQPINADEKDQDCLPGWQRFENRCYHFQEDSVQLPAYGELLCHKVMPNPLLKDKTTLAKITSSAQNDFVHSKLNGKCANIGGSDESGEGSWKYPDGQTMDYFNWAKQPWIQPDNGQRHTEGRENCIEMWEDGTWNDLMCKKDSGPRNCMHVCSYDLPLADKQDATPSTVNLVELEKEISSFAKRMNINYQPGQDINKYFKYDENSEESDVTLLHVATLVNDVEAVKKLLQHPTIDVNAVNPYNYTPLRVAAVDMLEMSDGLEVLKLLLQHPDLDVNLRNDYNITVLHDSSARGKVEVVREILQHPNVDVNAKNYNHATPLHLAAAGIKEGHLGVVVELLSHDQILPSAQDNRGMTPLHEAAMFGNTEIVRQLLANEVDPQITNNEGKTALEATKEVCLGYYEGNSCEGTIALLEARE